MKEVGHGEVVELQSHTSDNARLSPSKRQLNLVVGLLLQIPVDIHRSVLVVGMRDWIDRLGVEVTHGSNLSRGTLQGLSGEEVARLRAQLTADDILIESIIAIDADTADTRLLALEDTHFQVDAITYNVDLSWFEVVEDITIVPIGITHRVVILRQSFAEVLLVIDITLVHTKQG